jgi:cytochrome c biogenesis protein CcdA
VDPASFSLPVLTVVLAGLDAFNPCAFVVLEAKKPDIFRRARAVLAADSLPAMIAATVLLAIATNFYELLCTAGVPMVYARLLTLSDLPPAGRYLYLALYNLIYVAPLAVIVVAFARSLGARKLAERQGRLLKLLSGTMMLELGGAARDRTAVDQPHRRRLRLDGGGSRHHLDRRPTDTR